MEPIEVQVKTIEEAVALACEQWEVSADKVKATVVEEVPGLFGKTKLKVRVEPVNMKPAKSAKAPKKTEEVVEKAAPAEKPVKKAVAKAPKAEAKSEAEPEAPKEAPKAKAGRSRAAEKPVAVEASEPNEEAAAEVVEVVATEADGKALLEMIDELLDLAELEATVKVQEIHGRYVDFQLDGKDVAHLIGKQGEVLNQFQYLLNIMASRQHGNGVRITLDGNEYRTRREEKLRALAIHAAQQVLDRQEEAVFDALPAFERRIVHHALQEMEGIATYSEGEEPNRRVVIAPAD